VWNGRYDGVYAPRAESIQLLRSIRRLNIKASAYCGVDLHKIGQARRPVFVEVSAESINRDSIINAFRSGQFTVRGGAFSIPSSGDLTFVQELSIAVKQPLCRPWAG